jgi:hypothetical protein
MGSASRERSRALVKLCRQAASCHKAAAKDSQQAVLYCFKAHQHSHLGKKKGMNTLVWQRECCLHIMGSNRNQRGNKTSVSPPCNYLFWQSYPLDSESVVIVMVFRSNLIPGWCVHFRHIYNKFLSYIHLDSRKLQREGNRGVALFLRER